MVAIGEFSIPTDSLDIIESKSFKLYLNSLNRSAFNSRGALCTVLKKDPSSTAGAPVGMHLRSLGEVAEEDIGRLPGRCIDELDIAIDGYEQPRPELLRCDAGRVIKKQLYSHLPKSNYPATGQPDWGTLVTDYQGPALGPTSLLTYLVSFRQHQDLREQRVGRIFLDLQRLLQPQALSVCTCCVRCGGLGINPYRSLVEVAPDNRRLIRQ